MNINIKTTANKKSLRHLIYILCINTFVIIINMSMETNLRFKSADQNLVEVYISSSVTLLRNTTITFLCFENIYIYFKTNVCTGMRIKL